MISYIFVTRGRPWGKRSRVAPKQLPSTKSGEQEGMKTDKENGIDHQRQVMKWQDLVALHQHQICCRIHTARVPGSCSTTWRMWDVDCARQDRENQGNREKVSETAAPDVLHETQCNGAPGTFLAIVKLVWLDHVPGTTHRSKPSLGEHWSGIDTEVDKGRTGEQKWKSKLVVDRWRQVTAITFVLTTSSGGSCIVFCQLVLAKRWMNESWVTVYSNSLK